jgi:integrase
VAINKRGDKFVLDWWHNGRRYRKFFATQTEAKAYRTTEVEKKKLDGQYVAPDRIATFRDAATAWLATRANRRASTYGIYSIRVHKHLLPKFSVRKLGTITTAEIEKWRTELEATMGPTTIAALVGVLSSIFNSAMSLGAAASNPCRGLERAYRDSSEDEGEAAALDDVILSPEEIRALVEAATPGRWRTLLMLLAASGARGGELFALRWSRVIFDGSPPRIEIRETLSRSRGPGDVKPEVRFTKPKTKKGIRNVPIDPATVRALRRWKLESEHSRNDDLVFPSPNGKPLDRATVYKCALLPALKRAGLKRVTLHSLRHSFATGLITRGAQVNEVSARLGHAKTSMTFDIYTHAFKGRDSGAAAAYAEELFGAIDTN